MLLLFFFILILIDQIKSCPLTDEYLSRCHCGILTNGESYIKCDEYSLNEIPKFKRSFPYDELILINNNITNLSSSSFDNIKTIKRLNFQGNSLSYIDKNLFRLLGNYLEELILTGNNEINSLEFLTLYPLKKLRLIKLEKFNLNKINLKKIFINMTKLEIIYLNSCQLKQIPNINSIKILNLEKNFLTNRLFLSTYYTQLNLAENHITSIILQINPNLISLNLSKNFLKNFYLLKNTNRKLQLLDLSYNQLKFIDTTMLNDNLTYLNLSSNYFEKIHFQSFPKSLISLDLSSNQLQTIEKNFFYQQLKFFNLNLNPLNCNCHLQWFKYFNITSLCLNIHFQCPLIPRINFFNITFTFENYLFIQWNIIDNDKLIYYLQITIEQPYRISKKFYSNQTYAIILNDILFNQHYHVCLILIHKYAHDKYCRDIITNNPIMKKINYDYNDIIFQTTTTTTKFNDNYLYLLLIASCIGGLLTFILLLTCCYLCYQIYSYKYNLNNQQPLYEKCSQNIPYPIYHAYPTCPHHQIIYNSENVSNSTDSSHIDTSLSTTTTTNNNNSKHIYHTIDSQDYSSLKRQHYHLFELWNQSIKHKR